MMVGLLPPSSSVTLVRFLAAAQTILAGRRYAFPDDGQVGATIVQEAGKIDTPHDIINPGHRGIGSPQENG